MKRYLRYVTNNFMLFSIYKAHFFLTSLGNILYILLLYFLWNSIYGSSNIINGMSFNDTFIYLSMGSSIYWINQCWLESSMAGSIISGEIIVRLIKPVSYRMQLLFQVIGSTLSNLWTILIPAVIFILCLKTNIPVGINLPFFALSMGLGFLINFNIDYIAGLFAFYTESTWGISFIKESLVLFLSGAILPLPFFPPQLQHILEWMPFQAIYHIPLTIITSQAPDVLVYGRLILIQTAWIVVLFSVSGLIFSRAIKKITINGG